MNKLNLGYLIEEIKSNGYQIYQDMDGCLTDFDNQYEHFTGLTPEEMDKELIQKYGEKKAKSMFWEKIDHLGPKFWADMKWMSDGKKLWNFIKPCNPKLLSSPSRSQTSQEGKKQWVDKHLPGVELILRPASQKQEFANPNSILIDDKPSNIEQWKAKGGIGILHKSADDTISQLKELGFGNSIQELETKIKVPSFIDIFNDQTNVNTDRIKEFLIKTNRIKRYPWNPLREQFFIEDINNIVFNNPKLSSKIDLIDNLILLNQDYSQELNYFNREFYSELLKKFPKKENLQELDTKIRPTNHLSKLLQLHQQIKTEKDKLTLVKLAIQCAKLVLPIFEYKHSNDPRPRKAIQAAENWIKDPSEENKQSVAVAANEAVDAAYDDAASVDAAYTAASAAVAAYIIASTFSVANNLVFATVTENVNAAASAAIRVTKNFFNLKENLNELDINIKDNFWKQFKKGDYLISSTEPEWIGKLIKIKIYNSDATSGEYTSNEYTSNFKLKGDEVIGFELYNTNKINRLKTQYDYYLYWLKPMNEDNLKDNKRFLTLRKAKPPSQLQELDVKPNLIRTTGNYGLIRHKESSLHDAPFVVYESNSPYYILLYKNSWPYKVQLLPKRNYNKLTNFERKASKHVETINKLLQNPKNYVGKYS